jgi:hypothetical protein
VKKGNIIVFVAFGAGLSWGAVVWRWQGAKVGKVPDTAVTGAKAPALQTVMTSQT